MAIDKTITVDGQEIKVKASAAVPRIYRNLFGRDIFKDITALQADSENGDPLSVESLELFENLMYVFCLHADPANTPATPDEWLEQFSTFSVYQALPQIIELWGLNTQTTVASQKNSGAAAEK